MNTVVTSKEEILKASRELIQQKGWSAVNIRSVAAACGVSVGSIYNYYDSKACFDCATVESVWCEIFHRPEDGAVFSGHAGLYYLAVWADGIWLPTVSRIFSPSIPWALWGRTNRTGDERCSRPGSIFLEGLYSVFTAGHQSAAGCLYGTIYSGKNLQISCFL